MIRVSPECYPCFLRQADLAARTHGAQDELRHALALRVSRFLGEVSPDEVPAHVATRILALAQEVLGTDDPYRFVKDREFERFPEVARRAEERVAAADDPLAAALWLSAFGNIMDSGLVDRELMEREVSLLGADVSGRPVPYRLLQAILSARTVGVLLDNAGEAAYDVPLLSRLAADGRQVWLGVKGGPVLDDLTDGEAFRLGLYRYGTIVSNGNRGVGTDLAAISPEFRERLAGSDLLLVKGQANFETLYGKVQNAFFLLRVKCPVLARFLGRPVGETVVLWDGGAA